MSRGEIDATIARAQRAFTAAAAMRLRAEAAGERQREMRARAERCRLLTTELLARLRG